MESAIIIAAINAFVALSSQIPTIIKSIKDLGDKTEDEKNALIQRIKDAQASLPIWE